MRNPNKKIYLGPKESGVYQTKQERFQFLSHELAKALRFYNQTKNEFHLDVAKKAKKLLEAL